MNEIQNNFLSILVIVPIVFILPYIKIAPFILLQSWFFIFLSLLTSIINSYPLFCSKIIQI